jgi:hypothetical protein
VFNFFGLKKSVLEDAELAKALDKPELAEPAEVVAEVIAEVAPEPVQEVPAQMDTMSATREDVVAAYKIFLGRTPESMEVVDARVGMSLSALLLEFLASNEFLDQPQKTQLVLVVAKKILDARNPTSANEAPVSNAAATD